MFSGVLSLRDAVSDVDLRLSNTGLTLLCIGQTAHLICRGGFLFLKTLQAFIRELSGDGYYAAGCRSSLLNNRRTPE